MFPQHDLLFAGVWIYGSNFLGLEAAIIVVIKNGVVVGRPFETGTVLKRKIYGRGLHVNPLSRLNIKNNGRCFSEYLTRQGINDGVRLGPKLVRGNILNAREPA